MLIQYLYTLFQDISIQECSVVGIIDGSGTMEDYWVYLSEAWNEFIDTFKSSFCIQFDHTVELQETPYLKKQLSGGTMISLGFFEFIKLIRTNQLLKQIIVVFVTDGLGDDKIEDYVEELAKDFDQFHKEGYQIKFYTLAVGERFSYQIVAELKNRIHNSNLISSQMEYILNPETDFKIKLDAIKKDVFYKFIKIQPPIQLVPDGKLLSKVVANQTILSTNSIIYINGQEIDLSKIDLTLETLDQFIRQIVTKLMEDDSRGLDVKQQALKQLEIAKKFYSQIKKNNLENNPLRDRINKNIDMIGKISRQEIQIKNLEPVEAANLINDLQENNIYVEVVSLPPPALVVTLPPQPPLPLPKPKPPLPKPKPPNPKPLKKVLKHHPKKYVAGTKSKEVIELAKKKLHNIQKQVKTKSVFQDILKLFKKNITESPEYLVKKAMEGLGGAQLQQYVTEFEAESTKIFSYIHIVNDEV